MKDIKDENRLLKQIVANLNLKCRALKTIIQKNFKTSDKPELVRYLMAKIWHKHPPGVQDSFAEQEGVLLSAQNLA